jgi:putative phosphoribosyl transferase
MANTHTDQILHFKDRVQAGELLAQQLTAYQGRPDVVILALPRGGVPVAYQVASQLDLPLDIIIVRKIGMPGHKEFAIGAIASGGAHYLQDDVIQAFSVPQPAVDLVLQEEEIELKRREKLYRHGRPAIPLLHQTAIVIDDGLATGSSMKAAIQAVRKQQPRHIIVAVPVASHSAIESLQTDVDEVISLSTPEPFFAVGQWYERFDQTSDQEVIRLLHDAAMSFTKRHPLPPQAATR